jgi:GT2 family glycosyltransferase
MTAPRDVSVVVPTVGRTALVRACLESLSKCDPAADEILVVDQSGKPEVGQEIRRLADQNARLVACDGRGVSRGLNLGLRVARHDVVLVTHDDCTVDQSWVAVGTALMAADPGRIVTGRVLAAGDPRAVPSIKDDLEPHDYTGGVDPGALYPNNMALERSAVLALGGFDERFGPEHPAEDVDFCYRWLRSGRRLKYDPRLVVWHHEWRTHEELEWHYRAYARGQGAVYAKHLRTGDLTMLRFLALNVYAALRAHAEAAGGRRPRWSDPRRALFPGLLQGLAWGWRTFGSRS